MNVLRVIKTVKETKFESVWGGLKEKYYCLQKQSFTKYFGLTLVFV